MEALFMFSIAAIENYNNNVLSMGTPFSYSNFLLIDRPIAIFDLSSSSPSHQSLLYCSDFHWLPFLSNLSSLSFPPPPPPHLVIILLAEILPGVAIIVLVDVGAMSKTDDHSHDSSLSVQPGSHYTSPTVNTLSISDPSSRSGGPVSPRPEEMNAKRSKHRSGLPNAPVGTHISAPTGNKNHFYGEIPPPPTNMSSPSSPRSMDLPMLTAEESLVGGATNPILMQSEGAPNLTVESNPMDRTVIDPTVSHARGLYDTSHPDYIRTPEGGFIMKTPSMNSTDFYTILDDRDEQ